MRALLAFLFVASLAPLGAAAGVARAQEPVVVSSDADARARWNALSEDEREKLRSSYRELQRLPEEQRDLLKHRARAIAQERRGLEAKLSPSERETLGALGGEVKNEWLKKAVAEQLRSRKKQITALVPEARLQAALRRPASERAAAIRAVAEDAVRAFIARALEQSVKQNRLAPSEQARILALPTEDAARDVMKLRQQHVLADLERKPGGRDALPDSEWAELRELGPSQFFERLGAIRSLHKSIRGEGEPRGRERGLGPPPSGPPDRRARELRGKAKLIFVERGMNEADADQRVKDAPPWELYRALLHGRPHAGPPSRPRSVR